MPYKLSATLAEHGSDVRAVASPSPNLVLSASRDTTAIAWNRDEANLSFQPTVFPAGTQYVNSVTYLPPVEGKPGYLVAGGQDAVINAFSLSSSKQDPEYTMVGHKDNVCSLDAGEDGTVISGSWDKTTRVWKDFQCIYVLEGHSQAVWAVLVLEPGKFLTASADKTIKLWHGDKQVKTYSGHTDAVRGLGLIPGIGFASCANDSEIRVWTLDGDVLYTLSGHTSFVYSLAVLPTGEIVSSGEDRTLRIWRDGECVQTIVHPAISVWCVSAMPNGDIVSGTSDGIVRIFSNSEDRWASEAQLKEYEDQVSSQTINKEQVGDLKQSDIKGPEALHQPGTKDGQVLLVRQGSSVDAYQWDSTTRQWIKAGQVVDAVGSGRKQLYQGKEYDYVFDVDVQEGVPPLKLPYNANENPYVAAQRFLDANDLPSGYLDEVVKFIEKNTTPVNLGPANEYQDPFTGASRYRAPEGSSNVGNPNTFMDPFTGASRYSGAPTQPTPPPPPPPPVMTKILPIGTPLAFKQANVPAMRNKTYQINDTLKAEISTSALAISSQELRVIDPAFDCLIYALGGSTQQNPQSNITNSTLQVIDQVLQRWPVSQRFPVIDLARLISAFYPGAYYEPGQGAVFFNSLLNAAEWTEAWVTPLPKHRETNTLLALRAVANGLQVPQGAVVPIPDWVGPIFKRLVQVPYESLNIQHRVVLATIAFNLSCIFLKARPSNATQDLLQQLIVKILTEESKDAETVYRISAALGNYLHASKSHDLGIDDAYKQVFHDLVESAIANVPEERIKNIGRELVQLL